MLVVMAMVEVVVVIVVMTQPLLPYPSEECQHDSRRELSKARHTYITFLSKEGCSYLKD
ncbi:hypothetical protein [Candidatus Nitrosocaldus islandicus]|jgi:hypothetical protein|nr:hypothetical protein [Candidatus Nitrosocaldus islandicus]